MMKKISKKMRLNAETLNSCRIAAKEGASFAKRCLDDLDATMERGKVRIGAVMSHATVSAYDAWSDHFQQIMKAQMHALEAAGEQCRETVDKNIGVRLDDMEHFRITLFGRTMAGKSTLMEILTHGDGKHIGKGAQRTTQDVREYLWEGKNLHVTDVPGIGAFGGKEDEDKAFEAAKKGDLIIFLLTDDNPNPTEAAWMTKLRQIGKPILGILNVKVTMGSSAKLFERDMRSKFEPERLDAIIRQFRNFAELDGQDWENVQFIPCHLKCAFEAQKEKDYENRKKYEEMSRFGDVERAIIDCVQQRGTMIRMKTFIDLAEQPIVQLRDEIQRSLQEEEESRARLQEVMDEFRAKRDQLYMTFRKDKAQFEGSQRAALYALDAFIDENYDKSQEEITQAFQQFLTDRKPSSQLNRFLQEEDRKAKFLLESIGRKLDKELQAHAERMIERDIHLDFTGGKPVNIRAWTTNTMKVISSLSWFISFSNPAFLAGRIVLSIASSFGFFDLFTDDIEEKRQRRKAELRQELVKNIDEILRDMMHHVDAYELELHNRLDAISQQFDETMQIAKYLQEIQKTEILPDLAWNLDRMDRKLIEHAYGHSVAQVQRIVREMGKSMTLYVTDKEPFEGEAKIRAERMLQETLVICQ